MEYKAGYKGLSIVLLEAFSSKPQIVKTICRQIDKQYIPYIPYITYMNVCQYPVNMPISQYMRQRLGQNATVYKRYRNIPIDINTIYKQTIYSGYKGLIYMV